MTTVSEIISMSAEVDDILTSGNHHEKQTDCEKKLGSDTEKTTCKPEGSVVATSVTEEYGEYLSYHHVCSRSCVLLLRY